MIGYTNLGDIFLYSPEDHILVMTKNWSIAFNNYVCTEKIISGVTLKIYLHRHILKPPKNMVVDHIDGNPLNNQRENLRVVTQSENLQHSDKHFDGISKYKGVSYNKNHKKWLAFIHVKDKGQLHLGYYIKEENAARAYNAAAKKYFSLPKLNEVADEIIK